jgi:sensor histidine kinase YesM
MQGSSEIPAIIHVERPAAETRNFFIYAGLQWGCWGLWFWGQAFGEVLLGEVPWRQALVVWAGITLSGLWFTHLLRAASKIENWFALPAKSLLKRALISMAGVSALLCGISAMLTISVYGSPVTRMYANVFHKLPAGWQFLIQSFGTTMVVVAWVALYFGFMSQRQRHRAELRQAQLSEALQEAELQLLKFQLNPHFLFNALNGVRALIADEPAKAQDAVTQLARTLRYTLAAGDVEFVTLGREMEMVNDYLALESLRLADRLEVVKDIEPAALNARIPSMLLQTLVENAIKHGISPLKLGGHLHISARVLEKELLIEIGNPRPVDDDRVPVEGVGLRNTSARLKLLFGSAARLDLDLLDPARATARVRLPI